MKRWIFWLTIASGVTAAYLMLKRGASLEEVANNAMTHPFGSLFDELKHT